MSSYAISAPTPQLKHTQILLSAQNASWQGRLYSLAIEKVKILSHCINDIAYVIFFPLNLIFANTWVTSSICKKLNQNVLPMIEQFRGLPNHFAKLKTVFDSTFTIINTVQIIEDFDYFVKGKYKNHGLIGISAKTLLSIGHALEGWAWVSRIGLTSLSIGNSRVFRLLANSKVVPAVNGILAFTPAFFAVDTLSKIPSATNDPQKKALMMELAKHLGDLTLSLMMHAGRMSVINLGVVGLTCIGLEILNLIYKERHESTIR